MARKLSIPDHFLPSLKFLALMTDESFDRLLKALTNTQATIDVGLYADRVSSKDDEINPDDISKLIRALVPLFWLQSGLITADNVAQDAASALVRQDAGISEEIEGLLTKRLSILFGIEQTLGATAKAAIVFSDHERAFCNATILTDIRPIFSSNVHDLPSANTVVHTLKIAYHKENRRERSEFFVAMDSVDLVELELLIARAKAKAQSIERMLEVTHIPVLKSESD